MRKKFLLFLTFFLSHFCQAQTVQKKVYTFVEEMPEFPGGQDSLAKYLFLHIRYPASLTENGISGTVRMEFVIDTSGQVTDIKSLSDRPLNEIDKEVIRVFKTMPKWKPGRQKGQTVAVYIKMPLHIRPQDD